MKPLVWDQYIAFLRHMTQERAEDGQGRRIAIIGLPLLNRGLHPIKIAVANCMERFSEWQIVFMSEAHLSAFDCAARFPCDGVLARVVSEDVAAAAQNLPCPVVNISSLLEKTGVQTVRRDDRGVGRLCAEHLIEKGFQKFGIVELFPVPGWTTSEGIAGFLEKLDTSGRSADIHRLDMGQSQTEWRTALREWLRSLRTPCGIFLTDDHFAVAVIDICREEGICVPRDIAVITSGRDVEFTPEGLITHAAIDGDWLIGPAFERLDSLMGNPNQPLQTLIVSSPGIVHGASTDTLAVDDPLVARTLEWVEAHFQEGIQVSDVLGALQCSRRSLERRFSAALQTTPHEYLMRLRVAHAKKCMVVDASAKLETVAHACGFGHVNVFREAFLRATGIVPSKWRKAHASEGVGKFA